MGLNIGATQINNVMLGSSQVDKIMLGNLLVWNRDPSIMIATRGDGYILRSVSKGTAWTEFLITSGTSSGALGGAIPNFVYDGKFYCAMAINNNLNFYWSDDGSGEWQYRTIFNNGSRNAYDPIGIVKNGNYICIIGRTTDEYTCWYSSNNGTSFSQVSLIYQPKTVAMIGNIIVIGTTGNYIMRSTNYGASWTNVKVASGSYGTDEVAAANGYFYLGCLDDDNYRQVYRSTDGLSWSSIGSGKSFPFCKNFCNNTYYMGVEGYKIYYSTNGTSFTATDYTGLAGTWCSVNSPLYTGEEYGAIHYEGGSSSSSTKYSYFIHQPTLTGQWSFANGKMVERSSDARAEAMIYSQESGTL